jgi:hypothetical protein
MRRLLSVALLALSMNAHAAAQHLGDVAVTVQDGMLRTNAWNADGELQPARVFTATLGATGVAHFAADPGYEAVPGTFPTGMRIGWNATAGLRRWNGVDFVATDARMQFRYLTVNFTVSSGPVNGFSLLVQSDGGLHRHLNMTLSGAGGSAPAPGAYLAELQLFATSPAMSGDTYWILFNESLPEAEFATIEAETRRRLEGVPCPEDLDGSGEIDNGDVAFALLDYGPCPGCATDLDATGEVDFGDVALILLSTGPCP